MIHSARVTVVLDANVIYPAVILDLLLIKSPIMIDKERRKKLAFHLRQLSVGLTSNDDFESGVMDDISDGWLPEQYYRSKTAKNTLDDPIIRPMLDF